MQKVQTINPDITLPGFKVGKPLMQIATKTYPTDFGDLADPQATSYSRVSLSVPVTRPLLAMSIKTFVPIGLIVVCAALVFFVRPHYVEGPDGAWHHRASDPRRASTHLRRVAAGGRLFDDAG